MVGKRLRKARLAAGLTQTLLAERAGVNRGVVADLESGKARIPAFDKLVLLARALGVQPEELCPVPQRKAG
jgi:transcriptional regulator with XRE-family HTH domain